MVEVGVVKSSGEEILGDAWICGGGGREVVSLGEGRRLVMALRGFQRLGSSGFSSSRFSSKRAARGVKCVWHRKLREDARTCCARRVRFRRFLRLRCCMKMQPARIRRKTTPPMAMPTMEVVGRWMPEGVEVEEAEGSVIWTVVLVKTVSLRPMAMPGAGCWRQPASRATRTKG